MRLSAEKQKKLATVKVWLFPYRKRRRLKILKLTAPHSFLSALFQTRRKIVKSEPF